MRNNPKDVKSPSRRRSPKQSPASAGAEVAFHQAGNRPTARYVSATTVCEEALQHGRWIGLYWSAGGQVQRENITAALPGMNPSEFPLHAFDLEIDGQDLRNRWEWVGASERSGERPGTREAVVELRHQVRPVTVRVITRLDGTAFLVRRLEVTNTGSAPAALSRVSPWSGMLWSWRRENQWGEMPRDSAAPFVLGYFRGITAGTEGDFGWEALPRGGRRIEGANGHSGFGNPFFMVRNAATGETAVGALAWSGNWFMDFWRDPSMDLSGQPGRGLNLAFRMGPLGPAPLRVIAPGETVSTPEMHLALLHAGLDDCVAALHGHLRASVLPPRPKGKEFFTVGARVVEEPGPWILKEIDIAAEMGVDAFMVDAGWYGDEFGSWWERRGDWQVGDWIPGGLAACRRRCHEHGMKFGLWMEPEAVGPKSRLLREHPDWLLKTDGGREVAQMLDLAHPEAAKFMTDSILRVIREHRLDFFKIDYNSRVYEGGQRERDGLVENESLAALRDALRRLRPGAGGDARSGARMLLQRRRTRRPGHVVALPLRLRVGLLHVPPQHPRHQRADDVPPARGTLLLPQSHAHGAPEGRSRHAPARDAVRPADLRRVRCTGGRALDPYLQQTKRYINLAKQFTGPIMAGRPRVFHHTPNVGLQEPADWCVLEYAAQDRSRGYAGLFKLSAGRCEYRFRPAGVDASATYKVTLDNARQTLRLSGQGLLLNGIPVALDAALTSEMVLYEKA